MKTLLRDATLYSLGDVLFNLINFACFPLIAHLLQLADFGTIMQMMTLRILAEILFGMGFQNAMHRYFYEETIDRKQLISTGLAGILGIGGILLSLLFFLVPTPLIFLVIACSLAQKVFDYCTDLFRMELSASTCVLMRGLQRLLCLACSLYLIFLYRNVASYFWGYAIGIFLVLPIALILIRSHLTLSLSKRLAKTMLTYGFPITIAEMGYWSLSSIDRWMLFGEDLGLYGVAFKLSTIMIFLCTAFGLAWNPHSMRAYAKGEAHRLFFSQVLTRWFYALILVATLVGLFSREILHFLTPPPYWRAAPIIPFLAMGFTFYGTTHIFLSGISIAKKTLHITLANWFAAMANLILNLLLIPRYGAVGAAIASMLSYAGLTGYLLRCSQHFHPIPLQSRELLAGLTLIVISLCAQMIFEPPLLKIFFVSIFTLALWKQLPRWQSISEQKPLQTTPEIDILMAIRNGEPYIDAQMQSILQQDYPHFTVTVRENRSTDRTLERLQCYRDKIHVISTNDEVGALGNFSQVADQSTQDYIMFADCDDVWQPNKISLTMQKMQELEEQHGKETPLLIHTDLTVVDQDLAPIHPSFFDYSHIHPLEGKRKLHRQLVQNTITGNTVMVNRSLLDLARPIPKEAIMHDWWLGLVAAAFGVVGCVDAPTLLYRQHGHNDTGAKKYGLSKDLLSVNFQKSRSSNHRLLLQAEIFLSRFEERLDDKNRFLVKNYIQFLRSPPLLRSWYMAKNRFYKYGLLRTIKTVLAPSAVA